MLNEKEKSIIKKMKSLNTDQSKKELEMTIIATVLYGNETDRLDEIDTILDESVTLDEAMQTIFKDESVEIVDDDTKEE